MDDHILELIEKNQELIKALLERQKATTATPLHGGGGIFTSPGLEREIISAHVRPYGIADKIPLLPSVYQDPRFGAITGFTDTSGTQPADACGDAPKGYIKAATLTARFGRLRFDTNTIDLADTVLRLHRGDFTDLRLYGELLGTNLTPGNLNTAEVLNLVTMAEMVDVGVNFERAISKQIWQGTYGVANQFPGLDVQIATGQKDADSGVAVPALDSLILNFNYGAVGGTNPDIVRYLSEAENYLFSIAEGSGLSPVQFVVAMREQLWYELTAVWPCAYNTSRCSPAAAAGATVFIDGRENTRERDAMRSGKYIDINGRRYPVITDTGIYERNNNNDNNLGAGEFASDIYILPLTVRGRLPVLYREYVDYRLAQPQLDALQGMQNFFWTDNGVYGWAYSANKWCFTLHARTEQRIVLRTPQLAARITKVKYSPLQHLREPYPESPYFADGGVSLRGALGAPKAVWG